MSVIASISWPTDTIYGIATLLVAANTIDTVQTALQQQTQPETSGSTTTTTTLCGICHDTLDSNSSLVIIRTCSHPFHRACLSRWWYTQASVLKKLGCPICNTQLFLLP